MEHATHSTRTKAKLDVKQLVVLALLSAMAFISLFLVDIPVYGFLSYEPKDIFITLGGFLYGPMATVFMSVVISFLEFVTISTTGPIGLLMNIISTVAFAAPAAVIYRRHRTMSMALLSLFSGTVLMTGVMLLWNYLVTPLYMGTPRDVVASMLLPVFLPFNLAKAGLNGALTLLLYKPFVTMLRMLHFAEPSVQPTGSRRVSVFSILVAAFLLITCVAFIVVH
ncbi:ECF transporter S component [Ruminococcus champanellensis]|uniref:ECF transporter S component n=1 Tax=Ruminococcus champanellensis TaxID=1161942 RepID=UPI0039F5A872